MSFFRLRHIKYLFIGVLFLLCASVLYVFTAQADMALFFSDTYVERGVELPNDIGGVRHIQYEHTWTDFKGVVPEGTEVNSIFLHLTWSKVIRTVNEQVTVPVAGISRDELSATSTVREDQSGGSSSNGAESVESGTETNPPASLESESETPSLSEPIPEVEDVTTKPEVTEDVQTIEPEVPVDIEEVEAPQKESVSPPEESTSPSTDTSGFEQVSLSEFFPFVLADLEETVAEDVTTSLSAQEIDADAILIPPPASTPTDVTTVDTATEVPPTYFFEILYSVHGGEWQLLKHVGFDEEHELWVDLSGVGYDALATLRIQIRYVIPNDYGEKIVFDSLRLELGYGEPLIEVLQESVGYDDRTPNFEVGAVIADVQSENIRALILGRGGLFEFWYSVTHPDSGEIVWNKILGGGPIDERAPIAITERTIFWLDQNQQTLYGFNVDIGSLFGVSFEDPENKVFVLPFEDEYGKKWEAMFNTEENVLEFTKLKTKSR
jgi:hypothetical protein